MLLLGWEVGWLMFVAVAAIWLLQGVLDGMDRQGARDVEATQAAGARS